MLLGVYLGDALGAPCELVTNKRKVADFTGRFQAEWFHERTDRYGHYVRHELGQCTDDSEMTTALLDIVIGHDVMTGPIVRAYIEWANSGTRSLGTNTRALFHGYKNHETYYKRFKKRFPTDADKERAQSNGHLMRCSPFALIDCDSERQRAVEIDSETSNPSSVALKSEEVYLHVLRMCLTRKSSIEETVYAIRQYVGGESVGAPSALKECFEDALADVFTRNIKANKGWTLHALAASLHAAMRPCSFRENLEWVIRLGGDTDTMGCIAGGLLGALWGKSKMLEDPTTATNVEVVKKCVPSTITKTRDGTEKSIPRPTKYTWARVEALLDTVCFSVDTEAGERDTKRARQK